MRENKDKLIALGLRISDERKRRGITMERLAYEMDLSKGNLSEIERGIRDPKFSTLLAIAEGLDTTISKLLKDL
ncbi:helix-turn-helix transcriptional regulator [Bdellovibrio sp. SKB1291214]|uniref:helix-turn-helix domain-containing protein n=1 Tax=Bdellovibrio sp. SKB1291214 TaxID=1732569 RepID=UPI0015960CD4|nr:helix-turn-helix transcriptional regulator [Bdellovibrio sp. SKB1291214]UYL10282.1 helix-turn-helix transcriptional regulator [Bdellovibrio sp. SKB1291214]